MGSKAPLLDKRLAMLKNKRLASDQAGYRNGLRNEMEMGQTKISRE